MLMFINCHPSARCSRLVAFPILRHFETTQAVWSISHTITFFHHLLSIWFAHLYQNIGICVYNYIILYTYIYNHMYITVYIYQVSRHFLDCLFPCFVPWKMGGSVGFQVMQANFNKPQDDLMLEITGLQLREVQPVDTSGFFVPAVVIGWWKSMDGFVAATGEPGSWIAWTGWSTWWLRWWNCEYTRADAGGFERMGGAKEQQKL